MDYDNLTITELLKVVDRSSPEVVALAEKLERTQRLANHLVDCIETSLKSSEKSLEDILVSSVSSGVFDG